MNAPVYILGGPTATGKSALAHRLALRHGAVIVSADAMTVFRGLDIGTAKPSPQERAEVQYLGLDLREPWEDFSVADFLDLVEQARKLGPPVLVVGGTPFWLSALVRPMASLPAADFALRAELELLPDPHARLLELDPPTAARLHPNDRVRILRALEVQVLTGRPLSELHREGPEAPSESPPVFWLDRPDLRPRIEARVQAMAAAGYMDELRAALSRGVPRDARAFRSFAYRHLLEVLDGTLTEQQGLEKTARETWRFARKQRTWARSMAWNAGQAEQLESELDVALSAAAHAKDPRS